MREGKRPFTTQIFATLEFALARSFSKLARLGQVPTAAYLLPRYGLACEEANPLRATEPTLYPALRFDIPASNIFNGPGKPPSLQPLERSRAQATNGEDSGSCETIVEAEIGGGCTTH